MLGDTTTTINKALTTLGLTMTPLQPLTTLGITMKPKE